MKINGELTFPGDKSLSHRAAIFSAMAKGKSTIKNYLTGEDTLNTLKLFSALGSKIEIDQSTITIESPGIENWNRHPAAVDLGNSGTIARLALGLLAGINGLEITINGDHSLQKRPMGRITRPLVNSGAEYSFMQEHEKLPVTVHGNKLLPIFYKEELGSAQVKSALILAAIASQVPMQLEEARLSRDHTENMLHSAGILMDIHQLDNGRLIEMEPPYKLQPMEYEIWGDISSAAFFIVLGLLMKDGSLILRNILNNPFRNKFIQVLLEMGAKIEIIEKEPINGEAGCDIHVHPSVLKGANIKPGEIPSLIDELPILTIAGIFSDGKFCFRGARELRVKESDRIDALVRNLRSLGMDIEEFDDGLSFNGDPERMLQGSIQSYNDHRIVMSFEIARIISNQNKKKKIDTLDDILNDNDLLIEGREWTKTSFPGFYDMLSRIIQL